MTLAPRVIVGIDQAARSGWAVHSGGQVRASGVARSARERLEVVQAALSAAGGDTRLLLIVLEDHGKMPLSRRTQYDAATKHAPSRNAATILGMGDARGRWREQFELVGVPLSHFVLVEPRTWRLAVFGRGAPSMGTEAAKELAVRWASQVRGEPIADDNEAEAIAMASWGAREGVQVYQARLHEAQVRGRAQRRRPADPGSTLELALPGQHEGGPRHG